jgi:hypothetical protein
MFISRQKQRAVEEAKAREDKKTARIMATKEAARDLEAVTPKYV